MASTHNQCYIESLRTRQTASLKQLLNLNQPLNVSLAVEPVWKLLIFDRYCQDIISPLLSVKQLRELGVTLHLSVDSPREILPDVPAVYFVSPTEQNVQTICADLKRAMYDSFYLNMVRPIPRPLLEQLAESAVAGGATQQVQKLTDQFLSFISLEDDLFMLSRYTKSSPFSFYAINDPSITADQIDALVADIANGLFAVCVTLGVVPVIKCPKNNAAERVAEKLDQKIRDNLRDARNNLFVQENIRAGHLSIHRPVLVIADRTTDLSTMLHHTWTYQAMIADILEMELNRVRMKDKNGRQKDYEFGTEDKLWANYKGSPFPLVAEAIQEDLEAYRRNEDEIKRLKESMGLSDGDSAEMAVDIFGTAATAKLSTAVGSLPELLEKKRLIDLHTNVATALLDNIKTRKLDVLYETEEKLLTGQEIPVIETLRDCPDKDDILRLILIALCSRNMPTAEQRELQAFIDERAISSDALHFVRQLRAFSHLGAEAEQHQGAGTKTVSMFSKLLSHSSRFVMEGVKNLVPKKHNLPLTKVVDQLTTDVKMGVGVAGITGSSSDFDPDQFRLFDPKLLQGSAVNRDVRPTQAAADVIVFVIGGGNYVEYQNVQEWAKARGLQRCTYGCTEMVNPKQFVEQLTDLGAKSRAM